MSGAPEDRGTGAFQTLLTEFIWRPKSDMLYRRTIAEAARDEIEAELAEVVAERDAASENQRLVRLHLRARIAELERALKRIAAKSIAPVGITEARNIARAATTTDPRTLARKAVDAGLADSEEVMQRAIDSAQAAYGATTTDPKEAP